MAIDYDTARKRILYAFVKGMVHTYGARRTKKVTQRFTRPGKIYWDRHEAWTDPTGKSRIGRFKRMPSVEAEQTIEIPQGVVPAEMLQYASGMANAFLEVLRIAEDNGVTLERVPHPFVAPVPAVEDSA